MIEDIAVLIVSRSSSECSHCGGNASPHEHYHDMQTMKGEGCGARFVAIGATYVFPDGTNPEVTSLRPDLPFVDIYVNQGNRLPRGVFT